MVDITKRWPKWVIALLIVLFSIVSVFLGIFAADSEWRQKAKDQIAKLYRGPAADKTAPLD